MVLDGATVRSPGLTGYRISDFFEPPSFFTKRLKAPIAPPAKLTATVHKIATDIGSVLLHRHRTYRLAGVSTVHATQCISCSSSEALNRSPHRLASLSCCGPSEGWRNPFTVLFHSLARMSAPACLPAWLAGWLPCLATDVRGILRRMDTTPPIVSKYRTIVLPINSVCICTHLQRRCARCRLTDPNRVHVFMSKGGTGLSSGTTSIPQVSVEAWKRGCVDV